MEALIRLYARESRNQLQEDQQQADLLAAGLLLDLGLASEARARLETIDEQYLNTQLKSRLALIMARVFFQGQDFISSEQWLKVALDEHLAAHEISQKKMMQAQLLFSAGKFSLAAQQLQSIEDTGNLQLYAYYNHGLSLLNLQDPSAQSEGRLLLQKVSDISPLDQEQYALIDQAKLALGLDAVNSALPLEARKYFLNIRLDGLVSNDALLLLGWTFAQSQSFTEALTYWNTLAAKQQLLEPAIQEAWLAVPYAHQQMGDLKSAVDGYKKAVAYQQQAQGQLQRMLAENSWRQLLSNSKTTNLAQLSRGLVRQLMADPGFFDLLSKWQQLQELGQDLKSSLSVLPVIEIILQENELRYASRSEIIINKLASNEMESHLQNYQMLQQQLADQKTQEIAEATLSSEDYKHWSRLETINTIIDEIPAEVGVKKIAKFRLLYGVAKWKFHRDRDANVWSAEDSLDKLGKTLEIAQQRLDKLNLLISKPRPSLVEDVERVAALILRGDDITQQLKALQNELEQAMAERFITFVKVRQMALNDLAEQANLALARLQFKAIQEPFNNE